MAGLNFNKVIKAAMRLPVVTVEREPFLRKELAPFLDRETIDKVILHGTRGLVDKKIIDQIASGCIRYQTTAVCSVSALAGLPGGWAMAGTIPADVAQFYGNAIALVEKMLYLYGWPDMSGEDGQVSDQTAQLMILWIGVMMGAQGAQAAVRSLLDVIRAQVERKVLEAALNRTWVYSVVQQICKWIGVKLSEEGFARTVGKVIPLVGAPISAGITYFTFTPMCKKLKKELDFQWTALQAAQTPGGQQG
ncbi:MAG: hypothetical protein IJL93_02260 [Bacteroidales bacterium]|nr:hypothetical protein [Bacteroidales bacterium]